MSGGGLVPVLVASSRLPGGQAQGPRSTAPPPLVPTLPRPLFYKPSLCKDFRVALEWGSGPTKRSSAVRPRTRSCAEDQEQATTNTQQQDQPQHKLWSSNGQPGQP
jgi:hypothetical protein